MLTVGYKAIASYTVDFQQWAQTSWDTNSTNYATPIPYATSGSSNYSYQDVSKVNYLRGLHTDNIEVQPQDLSAAADITMKIDLPVDGFDAYYVKLRPALRPFVNSVTVEYVTYGGGSSFDDLVDVYKRQDQGLIVVFDNTDGLLDHKDSEMDFTSELADIKLENLIKTTVTGVKYLDIPKEAWNDGNKDNNRRNILYPAKVIIDMKNYEGKPKTEDVETVRDSALFVKGVPNGYMFDLDGEVLKVNRNLKLNASFEDTYESEINQMCIRDRYLPGLTTTAMRR